MPVARPVSSDARVIAHIDMDCFYVQVEQRKQPELRGLPTAVVQYNEWKGGGLIAVGYEARKVGVKRSMRGDEAKALCPQIQLVQVPVSRGKADLSIYRNAGSEVVSILSRKGRCERASIDEVYLDLTDAAETMLAENLRESLEVTDEETLKSHILGLDQDEKYVKENVRDWFHRSDADHADKLLACGALIVAELRRQVLKETEFTCSAGVAHNKMLAKLASGMNKPAQQTVVPSASVKELLRPLPIKKMKQLGGKLGDSLLSDLGVSTVGDLLQFSEQKLQECYGVNTGTWLWSIARGISGEEVEGRILPKSHGSGKTFPGPRALRSFDTVSHWLNELCEELSERVLADLEQNKRIAHTLTLHVSAYKLSDTDSQKNPPSKSCQLRYGVSKMQEDALSLFHACLREFMGIYGVKGDKKQNNGWGVTGLSVSASKILAIPKGTCSIMKFFPSQFVVPAPSSQDRNEKDDNVQHSGIAGNSESNVLIGSEENTTKDHILDLHNKETRKHHKDQGTCPIMNFFPSQFVVPAPSSQDRNEKDDIVQHSGIAGNSESNMLTGIEENTTKDHMLDLDSKETRIYHKDQGPTSILRFLKRSEPAPSWSTDEQNKKTCMPSSSGNDEMDGLPQTGENAERRESWSYKVGEIDPNVIKELPLDIQAELRGWMHPMKQPQPHSSKRRCITSYFSPS